MDDVGERHVISKRISFDPPVTFVSQTTRRFIFFFVYPQFSLRDLTNETLVYYDDEDLFRFDFRYVFRCVTPRPGPLAR